MEIKVSKTKEHATVPTYATDGAAGADLYACLENQTDEVWVRGGATTKIGTGICMSIPNGYVGLVFPRSGWAVKRELSLANCVGVIDSDYRGEIQIALYNRSGFGREVKNGDRIGQIVIIPFMKSVFDVVDQLDDTERGEGGFGSTGQ